MDHFGRKRYQNKHKRVCKENKIVINSQKWHMKIRLMIFLWIHNHVTKCMTHSCRISLYRAILCSHPKRFFNQNLALPYVDVHYALKNGLGSISSRRFHIRTVCGHCFVTRSAWIIDNVQEESSVRFTLSFHMHCPQIWKVIQNLIA